MGYVTEHEPMSTEELTEYACEGRSWVATDSDDKPVGYVIVDVVAGCAHIEQVSVHPDHQGAGFGRALISEVEQWATEHGLAAVTLTTFNDVPWNRPLYEHLGYAVLDDYELSPELQQIRDAETSRGLDPSTRVCMRKEISRTRSG
jgi:GNAT superfamily N-acetyltransferase